MNGAIFWRNKNWMYGNAVCYSMHQLRHRSWVTRAIFSEVPRTGRHTPAVKYLKYICFSNGICFSIHSAASSQAAIHSAASSQAVGMHSGWRDWRIPHLLPFFSHLFSQCSALTELKHKHNRYPSRYARVAPGIIWLCDSSHCTSTDCHASQLSELFFKASEFRAMRTLYFDFPPMTLSLRRDYSLSPALLLDHIHTAHHKHPRTKHSWHTGGRGPCAAAWCPGRAQGQERQKPFAHFCAKKSFSQVLVKYTRNWCHDNDTDSSLHPSQSVEFFALNQASEHALKRYTEKWLVQKHICLH